MKDGALPFQDALIAAQRGSAALTGIIAGQAYDRPPQGVAFPYTALGDPQTMSFGHRTFNGCQVAATIHVWSRGTGTVEARQINAALVALFDKAALSVPGWMVHSVRVESTRVMSDPDGRTSHGVVTIIGRLTPL